MKVSTEIHKSSSGKWKWELKVISNNKYDININNIVEPYYGHHISDTAISGQEDTLYEAELTIKIILKGIKKSVIDYKNESIKEKFWQWDDSNNEFKRSNI